MHALTSRVWVEEQPRASDAMLWESRFIETPGVAFVGQALLEVI